MGSLGLHSSTFRVEKSNPDKSKITNYKHQITNKSQISIKTKLLLFGILNLGHCDLFGICDLLFEILFACLLTPDI